MAHLRLMPPDSPQLDWLPPDSPAYVLNQLERLLTTVRRLAPDLTAPDCILLAADLTLSVLLVEQIEARAKARVTDAAKRFDLIA
jgi:hypothetical protein